VSGVVKPADSRPPVHGYELMAIYRGQRVPVLQALAGAQWAIVLDGVAVSVSSQSLSGFRSERVT